MQYSNRIKVGKHEYDIQVGDKFLDNGACVQLLTQSKEKWEWGHQPIPMLSKKAWKQVLNLPSYKKYEYGHSEHSFIYEILEV